MNPPFLRLLAGAACSFSIAIPLSARGDITWTCPPDKSVACDSAWLFDTPSALSTCPVSGGLVEISILNTVTSGVCPRIVTRTWHGMDFCGATSTCTQAVTLLDTNKPAALCSGVNHVPNPGFDNLALCPDFVSQVPYAAPWYPPTVATPDLFSTCATGTFVEVPANFFGVQAPLDGTGYAGAILYNGTSNNAANSYREYLQVPLAAPLVSGQLYRLSFHVSLAETSSWAIADIGAHVSVGPLVDNVNDDVLPAVPQVANAASNLLTSTTAWTLIDGVFVAAGGEDVLTIGNFLSDAATTATTNHPSGLPYAYYFIDRVRLEAVCESIVTGKTVVCGTPWTFNTPVAVDRCAGSNVSVTVASTVTNAGCPQTITRAWNLTDPCGNIGSWTQTVTVLDTLPPEVVCACVQDSAIDLLHVTGCEGLVPDLTVFTNCFYDACGPVSASQSPPAGTPVGPGLHSIQVLVEDCGGNVSTCEVPFHVTAPVPLLSCPTNLVVLTCTSNAVVNYGVTAIGNVGAVVCTPPSGSTLPLGTTLVTCMATSACGGAAECSFPVIVKQPKLRWGCGGQVGIGVPFEVLGGATYALRTTGQDAPAVNVTPGGGSVGSSLLLKPGPAEGLNFTTVLDFQSVPGAGFDVLAPPSGGLPGETTLLSVRTPDGSNYMVRVGARGATAPDALYQTIAVTTNGDLLNSFSYSAEEALTNDTLMISAVPGVTNCRLTVEMNFLDGSIGVGFAGTVDPSASRRKGWDGCIYGPDRPVKKPKARVMMIPPALPPGLPPLTELRMASSGWPSLTLEQPQLLTKKCRKWSDGHVTILKAFDDGTDGGLDVAAEAPGAEVETDLGFASDVSFRMQPFHDPGLPGQDLVMAIASTPSVVHRLRFRENASGLGGFDVLADFTAWGVSSVNLRLESGGSVVCQADDVPAGPGLVLCTINALPETVACDTQGVWRLGSTHGLLVLSGLDGSGAPCDGDTLEIAAVLSGSTPPPEGLRTLRLALAEDMDLRIDRFETVPGCVAAPLRATLRPAGIRLDWDAAGYILQGAERAEGPWYDLGNVPPVDATAGFPLRVFRLRCP